MAFCCLIHLPKKRENKGWAVFPKKEPAEPRSRGRSRVVAPHLLCPQHLCPLFFLRLTVEDSVMGCAVGVTAWQGNVGIAVIDGFIYFFFLLYSAEDTPRDYDILGMCVATPNR